MSSSFGECVTRMTTLAALTRVANQSFAERIAVVECTTGRQWTYRELEDIFNAVANVLHASGLVPGNNVAILGRNSVNMIAAEAGISQAGMVSVPINSFLSGPEIGWIIEHAEARALVFDAAMASRIQPIQGSLNCEQYYCYRSDEHDPIPAWSTSLTALVQTVGNSEYRCDISPAAPHRIMYTSGTTGRPKAVICPNEIIVGSIVAMLANQLRGIRETDCFLPSTPLSHFANGFFWASYCAGVRCVIADKFRVDEFCSAVAEYAVTHTAMTPTTVSMLAAHISENPAAASPLRDALHAIWYAGSPMPEALADEIDRLLGPVLHQQYGFTELLGAHPATAITQLSPRGHKMKPGSCGRVMPGAEVRIQAEDGREASAYEHGEIVVKASRYGGSYWKGEDAGSYRQGWIHSGDIGYFDEDGYFYLKARRGDMIISGGLNVYPSEVETVIRGHPSVRDCMVIGVEDSKWIEVPWAVVVPKHEPTATEEEEIIAFARATIAHYKAPKRILFADALPIGPSGKVLRRVARDHIKAKLRRGENVSRLLFESGFPSTNS